MCLWNFRMFPLENSGGHRVRFALSGTENPFVRQRLFADALGDASEPMDRGAAGDPGQCRTFRDTRETPKMDGGLVASQSP